MSELEPLSNDLADLFEQEKRATHDDPALRANVFHGVQLAIALAPSLPPAAPVAAKTATAAKSWLATVVAKSAVVKAGVVVIALGGGTAAVVATQHTSRGVVATWPVVVQTASPIVGPPNAINELPAAPVAVPDPVPAPAPESPLANTPPISPTTAATTTAPAAPIVAAAAPSSRALSREHALIDAARAALSRGDPGGAIGSLSEHAKLWPHGALVEEREALWIKALAKEGRKSDATDRAARFRKSFPNSILLPVVESAISN